MHPTEELATLEALLNEWCLKTMACYTAVRSGGFWTVQIKGGDSQLGEVYLRGKAKLLGDALKELLNAAIERGVIEIKGE